VNIVPPGSWRLTASFPGHHTAVIIDRMKALACILRELRVRSWTKNLFVFAAFLFGRIWSWHAFGITALATLGFCILAGSVYLINDIVDRDRDRLHPEKRSRPVASGSLSAGAAGVAAGFLVTLVIVLSALLSPSFALVAGIYFVMQLAYSLRLKDVVILDSLVIAMGFVLRALAGVAVAHDAGYQVSISPWLIVCTFFLALFLAFSKRRFEVVSLGEDAAGHRRALEEYSPHLLDEMIGISTGASLMGYSIYTVSERTINRVSDMLWITIPFVAYGIFRYLFLVHRKGMGGSPERVLLTDPPLLINVILWLVSVALVLRFFPVAG